MPMGLLSTANSLHSIGRGCGSRVPSMLATLAAALAAPLSGSMRTIGTIGGILSTRQDLIGRDDDLEYDQHDDNEFQAQRTFGIDYVGKHFCRFGDHCELAG